MSEERLINMLTARHSIEDARAGGDLRHRMEDTRAIVDRLDKLVESASISLICHLVVAVSVVFCTLTYITS